MSAETLRASFSMSRSLVRSHAAMMSPTKAASNPYSYLSGSMIPGGSDYGDEFHHDQYEHYRGRFWSGARVVVSRLASQPMLFARRGVEIESRSAANMIMEGYLPANGVPAWLGDPSRIQMISEHPIADAFSDPNSEQTHYNFMEMLGGSVLATGRAFIVAMASERKDRPWDLFPIPATWMKPDHTRGPFKQWLIRPPGSTAKPVPIDGRFVAYCYFADPSNPVGAISPLSMVARSVLSDEAISTAQYSEFRNGGMPKIALIAGDVMNETGFTDDPHRTSASRPVRLEPEQRRQIITWFQQQYAGAHKQGLPIVLDAIIRDLKTISRTPQEMGYLDSAGLTKEQIREAIGASEILSGNLKGVTRASGSLADQFFMDYSFNPMLTMISQALTKKICPLFAVDGEKLLAWIAPGSHRDSEYDIELVKMGVRGYALRRNDLRMIIGQRFAGIGRLEGFDDVIIPEKLEERLPEEDRLGVGRLGLEMGDEQSDDGTED